MKKKNLVCWFREWVLFKLSKITRGLIIVSYVDLTLKKYKTDRKRQKLTGDAYKWHSIF